MGDCQLLLERIHQEKYTHWPSAMLQQLSVKVMGARLAQNRF